VGWPTIGMAGRSAVIRTTDTSVIQAGRWPATQGHPQGCTVVCRSGKQRCNPEDDLVRSQPAVQAGDGQVHEQRGSQTGETR
jgi:hypothetical protein